jgi:hypothetical protein
MRPPLDVQTSFGMRIGCGVGLMALFVLPCLASGAWGAMKGEATQQQLAMTFGFAVVNAVIFGLVPLLNVTRRRSSASRFDEKGVTRFDGTLLPWTGFQGIKRTLRRGRSGGTYVEFFELQFSNGSALVQVAVVKNLPEVTSALESIEAGTNPWLG